MTTYIFDGYYNGPQGVGDNSDGLDRLIVTRTGYISSNVTLLLPGAWIITINGYVAGTIHLQSSIPSASTITVGRSGVVEDGFRLESGAVVRNSGFISGDTAILIGGLAPHSITNKGTIIGSNFSIREILGPSDDKVTNSGTIQGDLELGGGADRLSNSGQIKGYVDLGDGEDNLSNSGRIVGTVYLGFEKDYLSNSGHIIGDVDLSKGEDTLVNRGRIDGDVYVGDGADTLTNSGKIFGDVFLQEGDDVFKMSGRGTVTGSIELGSGKDTFVGGSGSETVNGGTDSDQIKLGGGNDTYRAFTGDGADTIYGGSGVDLYNASNASLAVTINLDTIAQNNGQVAANTATGAGETDLIYQFENAVGGAGDDVLYGSSSANVLEGSGGADQLFGFGGNDDLRGGEGEDRLTGGQGGDVLRGGTTAVNDMVKDTFVYQALTDSTVAVAGRDVIADFVVGTDTIDLSAIDAITGGSDDAFSLLTTAGEAFTGAGQLRFSHVVVQNSQHTLLEGDVNGDKVADFAILLRDTLTFTGSDFIL